MKLLLIDGSNILLRCAFGNEIPPEQSTPSALAMMERAANEIEATHVIVALDYTDAPSWRKLEYAEYKAHRTITTAQYLIEGARQLAARGFCVSMCPGYEADDVIATVALRVVERKPVVVLSNDSDLLPLTAAKVEVLRPLNGGGFQTFNAAEVCQKYQLPAAHLLYDWKAMVGDSGDNVPGVPGIGPKRACDLIRKFETLERIIHAGAGGYDKWSALVHRHADVARRALRLVSLRVDVPVDPIEPAKCSLARLSRRAA